jgi:Rod binding domain-containing protein
MYEQQFLGEMMQAMRKTVTETNESSMAEKIYKYELNDQYVEKWAENGGNGLAEQIYKELKEKILPAQHGRYLNQASIPKPTSGAGAKAIGQIGDPAKTAGASGPVANKDVKK